MSGLEIAGLAVAGATLGSALFQNVKGDSYQSVTTTITNERGQLSNTRVTATKGNAVAVAAKNGDLVARSWDGGSAMAYSGTMVTSSSSSTVRKK